MDAISLIHLWSTVFQLGIVLFLGFRLIGHLRLLDPDWFDCFSNKDFSWERLILVENELCLD
ncbi:hypothetical protein S83_067399, partial [Arachis hypogaea]